MSMSIASRASSDNLFRAAAAEACPKKEFDAQKNPPLSSRLDVRREVVSVLAEEEDSPSSSGVQTEGNDGAGVVRRERVVSLEEILRHRIEDDAWIVVDGNVYDVTQFLELHPGGAELVQEYLRSDNVARDAGPLMRGKVDEVGHCHSKAAFKMLDQFLVGSIEQISAGSGFEANPGKKKYRYDVDFKKPVVFQVGCLGADYDEWVHDPIISKDTPRFFESDFAELFTRTKWWVVPLVWVPVALAMIYTAVVKENVPLSRMPVLFAGGIFLWSSVEYLVHRFLFHMKTSSFWGNTLHYVLHGFHHKHPMDSHRLVFPPLFAAPICTLVWISLGSWAAAYPDKLVIYAIGLLNYVMYDVTHYFLHFGAAFSDYSRQRKRYHLNHHFKDQTTGFGITGITRVWDIVFQTYPTGKLSIDETKTTVD